MKFKDYGINIKNRTSGQIKVICPKCSHDRKKSKEPCLSVNIDDGLWNCKHCGWSGGLNAGTSNGGKVYKVPEFNPTKLNKKIVDWFRGRGIDHTCLIKHKVSQKKEWMPHKQKEMWCIAFPYYRNGQAVNVKYRSGDKGFKMVKDAELIFYNLDSIVDKNEVIITEGEIDCMSFDIAGYHNVISVPNGASKGNNSILYLDNCWEAFDKIEKIYLAMDADEAGQSLLNEMARRLGKERCYKVRYPDRCKDANDVLVEYGTDKLKKCIVDSEPFPIEGVINAMDCEEGLMELYYNGSDTGDSVGFDEFDKLCTFKTSMMYMITGIPAHGKSTFINSLEIRLAVNHGWKFGVFSPEHFPIEYLIYRYAEILTGKPFFRGINERMSVGEVKKTLEFINEHFFFIRPEGEIYTLERIMEAARGLVGRYGIKGLTIDPWNSIDHDFKSMSETQYIERALNKLTIFKQVNDVAIFLVAHPKKMQKIREGENSGMHEVPTLYDISGSSNFFNKADVGITVYRNYNTKLTEVYVQKVKFKNIGEVGYTDFQYVMLNNRFLPAGEEDVTEPLLKAGEQAELSLDVDETGLLFDTEENAKAPF